MLRAATVLGPALRCWTEGALHRLEAVGSVSQLLQRLHGSPRRSR